MKCGVSDVGSIRALTDDLCRYRTMVVGGENKALFERIKEEVPVKIHRFRSGSECNGWIVPHGWTVKRATISRGGKVLFDGSVHSLGVAMYSRSFQGQVSLEELNEHVATDKNVPDALLFHCRWQYRPWAADWAFSIPYATYKTFTPGKYDIDLVTEYSQDEMLCGEVNLKGRLTKTIVFNSHTCHPHMANDGFTGVATLIRLYQWLRSEKRKYSYKMCLWPEHLGTVFYLERFGKAVRKNLVGGMFYEMGGVAAPLKATETFLGGHVIDHALRNALRHYSKESVHVPWRTGAGNDETVWEAPGYEVPFIELTRCKEMWNPYREYHTSLDTPSSVDWDRIDEAFRVLQKFILSLELDAVVQRKFDGLICLSNPKYDLYMERKDPSIQVALDNDSEKWGNLVDCMFRYFDGKTSILEIAERHQLPFERVFSYISQFAEKGLVTIIPKEIDRVAISTRKEKKRGRSKSKER